MLSFTPSLQQARSREGGSRLRVRRNRPPLRVAIIEPWTERRKAAQFQKTRPVPISKAEIKLVRIGSLGKLF